MGRSVGLIVAAALALGACATPPGWSERVTVAVDRGGRELAAFSVSGLPSPLIRNIDDLMLCVVDMDGAARCHHRDGIVSAAVAPTAASATCPGADAVLRSPCRAGEGCRFSSVAVPSSTFAMMLVELRVPRFGVPRHVVSDAAVVSQASGFVDAEGRRLEQSIRAVARCLAPGAGDGPRLTVVDRGACENDFCKLNKSRVKLSREREETR
jgi:hypothetical protein